MFKQAGWYVVVGPFIVACGGGDSTTSPPQQIPVAAVAVQPASLSLTVGQTGQLTATVRAASGAILSDRAVTWSSSDAAVATTSNDGVITAVSTGAATITATSEGKSGNASVTVIPVPVASVVIALAGHSLAVGETMQLSATPRDAHGDALANRTVVWATSDATIATVSGSGLLTAMAEGGPVTITATSESVGGTVQFLVGCPAAVRLEAGNFAVLREPVTDGCIVDLEAAGDYMAVAFISESGRLPDVSSFLDLPHSIVRLDLAGGSPTVSGPPSPPRYLTPPRVGSPNRETMFMRQDPDRERRMVERSWTATASARSCSAVDTGAAIPVPTERYGASSGQFAGHVRNVFAGPIETWRVALTSARAVVVVDSVFWSALPGLPADQQALATLTRALEQSVLPAMARYGLVPRDLDGDGRVLLLVPRIPFGSDALAASLDLGSLCPGVVAEAVVVPSSRYQSSQEFGVDASMADAASTLMHELTHLAQSFSVPTAWYNAEGMARLAEHVWRLGATSTAGFATHLSALPLGEFEGQVGRTNTGQLTSQGGVPVVSKHCIDPSLEGLDYRRLPGNIRAYDRGCWALARLAANLFRRGTPESGIFGTLMAIRDQSTMHAMWNELTGESRTADEFIARWLAGALMEEFGVVPRDASLRDPIWDIASIVTNTYYRADSRVRLAPAMDASLRTATLEIVDESAMMAIIHAGDHAALRIGTVEAGRLGPLSHLRLLLVRLH